METIASGEFWTIGWDIPTEWAIDKTGQCWMNNGHGGVLKRVDARFLISEAETEDEKNMIRTLVGLPIPPPEWHKLAIAAGWTPPKE